MGFRYADPCWNQTNWFAFFVTIGLAALIGYFLVYEYSIPKTVWVPRTPEEIARARAQRDLARKKRLEKVPDDYGKATRKKARTRNPPKRALPEPEKYLPTVTRPSTGPIQISPDRETMVATEPLDSQLGIIGRDGEEQEQKKNALVAAGDVDEDAQTTSVQQALLVSLSSSKNREDDVSTMTGTGFHHIPGLPNEIYAEFLPRGRLATEFLPIIERRGYKVIAVSE